VASARYAFSNSTLLKRWSLVAPKFSSAEASLIKFPPSTSTFSNAVCSFRTYQFCAWEPNIKLNQNNSCDGSHVLIVTCTFENPWNLIPTNNLPSIWWIPSSSYLNFMCDPSHVNLSPPGTLNRSGTLNQPLRPRPHSSNKHRPRSNRSRKRRA